MGSARIKPDFPQKLCWGKFWAYRQRKQWVLEVMSVQKSWPVSFSPRNALVAVICFLRHSLQNRTTISARLPVRPDCTTCAPYFKAIRLGDSDDFELDVEDRICDAPDWLVSIVVLIGPSKLNILAVTANYAFLLALSTPYLAIFAIKAFSYVHFFSITPNTFSINSVNLSLGTIFSQKVPQVMLVHSWSCWISNCLLERRWKPKNG